jgi:3'(2'), 5'-bisphosphate nucleotidase
VIDELKNIVRNTGNRILAWRNTAVAEGKWEGTQFKCRADKLAHKELCEKLRMLAPTVPVISEEDEHSQVANRPERYWLIDPIDGTASFAHGYDGYVTQVALMHYGFPTLAAIYAPSLKLLFLAQEGKGAYLNGKRFFCQNTEEFQTLIDNYPQPRGVTLAAFKELHFEHYVECGGISLKICRVADGSADLFFKDVVVRDWDLGAPHLVLHEAGGTLTDVNGRDIAYRQSYRKDGLIAAPSKKMALRFASWYESHLEGSSAEK